MHRGAIESPSLTYWHAPTHLNSLYTSLLPTLPTSPLPARNLATEMGGVFLDVLEIIRQDCEKVTLLKKLRKRQDWRAKDFAFVVSARVAMKERPKNVLPIIYAELQQDLDTPTWH